MRVELVDRFARDLDGTAIRFRLASDQAKQRRFSRAACTQDRDKLAARNPEAQALQEPPRTRSEEHTSELQSQSNLVCRLLLEKKKKTKTLKQHYNTTIR